MTPLECADGIANFLREELEKHEERENATGKPYDVYVGQIPQANKVEEMRSHCPLITIRIDYVDDGEDETVCEMTLAITLYDPDERNGCRSLYHIAEFIRFALLTHNPISRKYKIKKGSFETVYPIQQPDPLWIGQIGFAIHIQQPQPNPLGKYPI